MKTKHDPSQLELFQKIEEKISGSKIKNLFSNIKPKNKLVSCYVVNVPYENIIVACIGILFLAILSFCLGVKKGEAIFKTDMPVIAGPDSVSKSRDLSAAEQRQIIIKPQGINIVQAKAVKEDPANLSPVSKGGKYTIQLVTYSRQMQAEQEINKLKKSGLKAFVLADGRFYKVCSGIYADPGRAREALTGFKKNRWYKDSFVKKIASL